MNNLILQGFASFLLLLVIDLQACRSKALVSQRKCSVAVPNWEMTLSSTSLPSTTFYHLSLNSPGCVISTSALREQPRLLATMCQVHPLIWEWREKRLFNLLIEGKLGSFTVDFANQISGSSDCLCLHKHSHISNCKVFYPLLKGHELCSSKIH